MVLQKKESESEHSDKEDSPLSNHNNPDDHSNHIRQRNKIAPSSSVQEIKTTEEDNYSSEHSEEDDDEKEWNELQKEMKQKSAAKVNYNQSSSWPVHAPFFPEVSCYHGYYIYL